MLLTSMDLINAAWHLGAVVAALGLLLGFLKLRSARDDARQAILPLAFGLLPRERIRTHLLRAAFRLLEDSERESIGRFRWRLVWSVPLDQGQQEGKEGLSEVAHAQRALAQVFVLAHGSASTGRSMELQTKPQWLVAGQCLSTEDLVHVLGQRPSRHITLAYLGAQTRAPGLYWEFR